MISFVKFVSLYISYNIHMENRKFASGLTLVLPLRSGLYANPVPGQLSDTAIQFQPYFFQAITYLLARPHN